MKYLILLMLLVGCSPKKDNKTKRIKYYGEMKIGDCFEIPDHKAFYFKVVSVGDHSYMAGGQYSSDKNHESYEKFYPKYPSMQISVVSKQEKILKTDCPMTKQWLKDWDEAILNEYKDKTKKYSKDAVLPKE